jgi:hypothetical protein
MDFPTLGHNIGDPSISAKGPPILAVPERGNGGGWRCCVKALGDIIVLAPVLSAVMRSAD